MAFLKTRWCVKISHQWKRTYQLWAIVLSVQLKFVLLTFALIVFWSISGVLTLVNIVDFIEKMYGQSRIKCILQFSNLKICLIYVFSNGNESRPIYAQNHYAFKKEIRPKALTIGVLLRRTDSLNEKNWPDGRKRPYQSHTTKAFPTRIWVP